MKKYIFALLLFSIPPQYFHAQTPTFDWQGHRGSRGLMPENTIPAFLKALDLGMKTLELDLTVSADNQLIISHEPWLNHDICLKADVFSPAYLLVTKKMVKQCHNKGIKIVPWTVNETKAMLKLMKLGVDGIITDYPNRIPVLNR